MSDTATLDTTTTTQETDQPWNWNLILHDSDVHSYDYVIELATTVARLNTQDAFKIAKAVDTEGRAVLLRTHKELAELKLEQVKAFGADPRVPECSIAMRAHIEPAT